MKTHRDEVRTIREEELVAIDGLLHTMNQNHGCTLDCELSKNKTILYIVDKARPAGEHILYSTRSPADAETWLTAYLAGHVAATKSVLEKHQRVRIFSTGNLVHVFVPDASGRDRPMDDPRLPAFSVAAALAVAVERLTSTRFLITLGWRRVPRVLDWHTLSQGADRPNVWIPARCGP